VLFWLYLITDSFAVDPLTKQLHCSTASLICAADVQPCTKQRSKITARLHVAVKPNFNYFDCTKTIAYHIMSCRRS